MRLVVETNALVRAVVQDDPAQARIAAKLLTDAELIAVALPCLCEFVWVLLRVYGFQAADASSAIRALLAIANVAVNRPAAEAGLLALEASGDFADGVIAYEGSWLGGETFVSFDKKAVTLLKAQGQKARLLCGMNEARSEAMNSCYQKQLLPSLALLPNEGWGEG